MADYKKKKGIKVRLQKPHTAQSPVSRPVRQAEPKQASAAAAQNTARPQQEKRRTGGPKVRPNVPVQPYTGSDDFSDIDRIHMEDSRIYKEKKRIKQLEKPPMKRMPARRAQPVRRAEAQRDFRVVKGGKAGRRFRLFLSVGIVAALALTLVILHFSAPVGIVEWVQNYTAGVGAGDGYPVTLSDNQTDSIYMENGRVLALSGTLLECYNKSGKQVYARQHGFSNPALASSASRTLVYDRGGTGIKIYNDSAVLEERKLENTIVTAAVGRNGSCAFVTRAEGYAAQVSVVDKNFGSLFNWWSAEEMISAVAVSDDGRRVAAAAVKSEGGRFISTLYIFDIKKTAPVATLTYEDAAIVALQSPSGKTMTVVTGNTVSTVSWNCQGAVAAGQDGRVDYTLNGQLRQVHTAPSGVLLVTGRAGDETANQISLLDEKGVETASFSVEGNLKSAAVGGDILYCLFDHAVKAYGADGMEAGSWDCGYASTQLTAGKDGTAYVLGSGKLTRYGPPEKSATSHE